MTAIQTTDQYEQSSNGLDWKPVLFHQMCDALSYIGDTNKLLEKIWDGATVTVGAVQYRQVPEPPAGKGDPCPMQ